MRDSRDEMKAHSKDLRLRVLAAVDRRIPGRSRRLFDVSAPTRRRYLRLRRETGNAGSKSAPSPPARNGAALEASLPDQARASPDLTPVDHCELFEEEHHVQVATATMSRTFERLKLPLKKVPLCGRARRGRAGALTRAGKDTLDFHRFVFVNKCGTHASMIHLRILASRGERAYDGRVPRNRGSKRMLIASMTICGMGEVRPSKTPSWPRKRARPSGALALPGRSRRARPR